MSTAPRPEAVYLCKLGHRTNQPGLCPQDRSRVEPAQYICDYCDHASRVRGKSGKCPNCEAPLRSLQSENKPATAA